MEHDDIKKRNQRTLIYVMGGVFFMVALAFASVPLYTLFCRVTGFGGTTQVATALPDTILDRVVTVHFNSDIASDLPWEFKPDQRAVDVKLGQQALVSYTAKNMASSTTSGTALYNVTPPKAGKYFHKIQCFCFDLQSLEGRQEVNMPIMFFIDPKMDEDRALDDVTTITLSYTFYKADTPKLEKALSEFNETN